MLRLRLHHTRLPILRFPNQILSRIHRTQSLHPIRLLLLRVRKLFSPPLLPRCTAINPKTEPPTPLCAGPILIKTRALGPRTPAREIREQVAEQAFCGWRARRHDVYCGLGDGDCDANVPGAILHGRGEAVVVDDEAADGHTGCDPPEGHDDDDEDFGFAVHLEVPDHYAGDGDYNG
jgi:hypothetical protein